MFDWFRNTFQYYETGWNIASLLVITLAISLLIIFVARKSLSFVDIVLSLLLTFIFLLLYTMGEGSNIEGSLAPTTFPYPPHLGLDGIPNME